MASARPGPKYIILAAMTLDGKIATRAGEFTGWTSKEDKENLHRELDAADVVLVGRTTYVTARRPLSKRTCIVLTRHAPRAKSADAGPVYFDPQKADLRTFIKKKNYRRVAILGGTQTYTWCLDHGMVDEIHVTIEPVVFGKGLSMFDSRRAALRDFTLVSAKRLNKRGSTLLRFKKK